MFNQEKFLKAWLFASKKHKDQKYPGDDLPYLTHIGNVVMEVIAVADSIPDINLAVSCAILHDTIEDSDTTYNEIVDKFSIAIADGVMALTKNNQLLAIDEASTKEAQMKDSLERIKKQPKSVWAVKLADRIANLGEPPTSWDNEKRLEYVKSSNMILSFLGNANSSLFMRLQQKIENYQMSYCVDNKNK